MFKCFVRLLTIALLGMAIAWFFRGSLLTAFTDWWIVDEKRVQADAVVVLGGGANTRTFAAAKAYHGGLVGRVLIPQVKLEPIEKRGYVRSHTQICTDVVLGEGVPESVIEYFGEDLSSTWEEGLAIKAWVEENQPALILAPIEFPHTRRLRWVLDQILEENATRVHVIAIDDFQYDRDNWWTNEYGLIDVQNDIIKYIFYRFKY